MSGKNHGYDVDFLFVYEVKARELESIALLRYELERRGYTVAFLNSWHCLTHKFKKYSAKVVVIPAAYNDGIIRFFSGHALSYEKLVNLQWEQLRANWALEDPSQTPWVYSGLARFVMHLCWGENTKRRLQESFSIHEAYTQVTGYIPLDFYRPEFSEWFIPKEKLFRRYKLDPAQKTLLFVSSLSFANPSPQMAQYFSKELFTDICNMAQASQQVILSWIQALLQKYPELQFVYRPHPSENSSTALMEAAATIKNFYCVPDEAIKHWLTNVDVVYNWWSTSTVEMKACGKPTYLLRPVPIVHAFNFPMFEQACTIDSYAAFEQSALESMQGAFPVADAVLGDYYYQSNKPAYVNVCDTLTDVLETNKYRGPQEYKENSERFLLTFLRAYNPKVLLFNIYAAFWNSKLNQHLIAKAHAEKKQGRFWEVRRTAPEKIGYLWLPKIFTKKIKKNHPVKRDPKETSYEKSMAKNNQAGRGEIKKMLAKIKQTLANT